MKIKMIIIAIIQSLLFSLVVNGQVPQAINFQAVAKLSNGTLVKDQAVAVLVNLTQENLTPQLRYSEVHHVSTNSAGHFVLQIGTGTAIEGSFDQIQWELANVILDLEMDVNGGSNYTNLGATQLLTVPYSYHSESSKSLVSSDNIEINAASELIIGDEETPDIYTNGSGKIGIGTRNLDPDNRKDIELGINKRLWGYSDEYHLDKSGVYNLQAVDSLSKPAVVWYDWNTKRQAAIVAHYGSGGHDKIHNHWSIETTTESGELFTRMEFPLDLDWTTIETHSADFKVGDGGSLITSGNYYGYNMRNFAFGDKNWDSLGLYGGAKWEFYRASNTARLLIHQGDGTSNSEVLLKSGESEWRLRANEAFEITNSSHTGILISPSRYVGIGVDEPTSKLHVNGDVKVTSGHGFITEGADFAEFFQSENELEVGDIVGINLKNGLARVYHEGDALLGVVSDDAGFIGNTAKDGNPNGTHTLVGLTGQLRFDPDQVIIERGIVYTKDMQKIGILLASGKVFLRMK